MTTDDGPRTTDDRRLRKKEIHFLIEHKKGLSTMKVPFLLHWKRSFLNGRLRSVVRGHPDRSAVGGPSKNPKYLPLLLLPYDQPYRCYHILIQLQFQMHILFIRKYIDHKVFGQATK